MSDVDREMGRSLQTHKIQGLFLHSFGFLKLGNTWIGPSLTQRRISIFQFLLLQEGGTKTQANFLGNYIGSLHLVERGNLEGTGKIEGCAY